MKTTLLLLVLCGLSPGTREPQDPTPEAPTVQAFQIETLLEAQAASERTYTQFLRVPALHAGIYTLPAQGQDTQNPHREDEVYYVFKGAAKLRAGGEDHPVKAGSILYVKANEEHRFVDISEDLEILVLFSTAPTDPRKDAER